jgi:DNA polymerase-3 subunit alpha
MVRGRADLRGRELQLVALDISEPNLGGDEDNGSTNGYGNGHGTDPLVVDVPAAACTDGLISRLKALLALYPGSLPVIVRLIGDAGATQLRVGEGWRVDGSAPLLLELKRLFGEASVRLVPVDA